MYYLIDKYDGDAFVGVFNTVEEVCLALLENSEETSGEYSSIFIDGSSGRLLPDDRFVLIQGEQLDVDINENKTPNYDIAIKEL